MKDDADSRLAEPMMTANEVAEMIRVTPNALGVMRFRGYGPNYIRISPHCVRYRRADVLAFIDSHTVTPSEQADDDRAAC